MAIYRTVSMSFWTDSKVVDEFTPEDKYFYLYLFTNPHTNLCGCYELSIKQVELETGYSKDAIYNLIKRFESVHDVVRYSKKTKEILLINWSKYNWTTSDKFRKPLAKELENIKEKKFREYLVSVFNGENKRYPIDTNCIDTSDTVTDTDTVPKTYNKSDIEGLFETLWKLYPEKKGKGKVSDKDKRLIYDIGLDHMTRAINRYIAEVSVTGWKHYQNGNTFFHSGYLDYLDENYEPSRQRDRPACLFNNAPKRDYDMEELERKLLATN